MCDEENSNSLNPSLDRRAEERDSGVNAKKDENEEGSPILTNCEEETDDDVNNSANEGKDDLFQVSSDEDFVTTTKESDESDGFWVYKGVTSTQQHRNSEYRANSFKVQIESSVTTSQAQGQAHEGDKRPSLQKTQKLSSKASRSKTRKSTWTSLGTDASETDAYDFSDEDYKAPRRVKSDDALLYPKNLRKRDLLTNRLRLRIKRKAVFRRSAREKPKVHYAESVLSNSNYDSVNHNSEHESECERYRDRNEEDIRGMPKLAPEVEQTENDEDDSFEDKDKGAEISLPGSDKAQIERKPSFVYGNYKIGNLSEKLQNLIKSRNTRKRLYHSNENSSLNSKDKPEACKRRRVLSPAPMSLKTGARNHADKKFISVRSNLKALQGKSVGNLKAERSNKEKLAFQASLRLDPDTNLIEKTKQQFRCKDPKCPAAFDSRRDWQIHLKRHTNSMNSGKYKCDYCSYRVFSLPYIESHLKLHGISTSRYKLQRDAVSQNCQNQKNTTPTRINRKRFKCSKCAKMFRSLGLYKNHLSQHEVEHNKSQICDSVLRPRSKDDESNSKKNDRQIKSVFRCHIKNCPEWFSAPNSVTNHLVAHQNEFRSSRHRYKCKLCTFSSPSQCRFLLHQDLHRTGSHYGEIRKSSGNIRGTEPSLTRSKHPSLYVKRARPGVRQFNKQGFTEDQLNAIRTGNPSFNYETHYIQPNGVKNSLKWRCFYCPRGFAGLSRWLKHQNFHQDVKEKEKIKDNPPTNYTCDICKNFSTHIHANFVLHCSTHPNNAAASSSSNGFASSGNDNSHLKLLQNSTINTGVVKSNANAGSNVKSGDFSTPTEENKTFEIENCIISAVQICNFMSITARYQELTSSLTCVHGIGKTATVISILIGIGYDVLLNLTENENLTICGIGVNSLVKHGESTGSVEVTFQIKCPDLQRAFGSCVKVRRTFQQGVKLSECTIQILDKRNKYETITATQFKSLMGKLIPTLLLRLMVLNAENVQYLAENFSVCETILKELAGRKKRIKLQQMSSLMDIFRKDLTSRQLRISFIKDNLSKRYSSNSRLRQLQVSQAIELRTALDQFQEVNDLLTEIVNDAASIKGDTVSLLEEMRRPFQEFLQTQKHVGDIMLGESGQELVVWMMNQAHTSSKEKNLEEARQLWKGLTIGRRKLAVLALYFSFWEIMDCCPFIIADAYSSTDLEFHIPSNTWPFLVDLIGRRPAQKFILTVPDEVALDLLQKSTA